MKISPNSGHKNKSDYRISTYWDTEININISKNWDTELILNTYL